MSNRELTTSIIAKAAVEILENELVASKLVYRGYEDEFQNKVNGYMVGDTISIRKPTDFTVRTGATASIQDIVEGKETFTVGTQIGVDFKLTSVERTLNIDDLSERVIRPAMIQLANSIDADVLSLYKDVWNWVGTPGKNIAAFTDFAKGPERLDLSGVPNDRRVAVLSPTDHWALAGSQTALYLQTVGQPAYRTGEIGRIGAVETNMSQNVQTFTTGARDNTTPIVNGASQNVTWANAKDTEAVPATQTLLTKGHDSSTTIKAGDVFTISGVYAVNPVTKATLAFLQQFVVKADVTANETTTATTTLTIAPAIITSGANQTVSAVPADSATITFLGTASTGYPQNLIFHPSAFGLVVVPMVRPQGAVDVARESYKGLSVRLIPYYDGTYDVSNFRLDVLYGKKTIDPRKATRISGTT